MNNIDISAENIAMPEWEKKAHILVQKVLDKLGCDNWNLSILFCDDAFIQDLNKRFRNKDEATDVLSFPLGETIIEDGEECYEAGDIVISLETLENNSRYFNVSRDEELRRLLIHGILHLKGHDHASNDESEPMLRMQERILAEIEACPDG
jgi:probable rRNA maturation factor